MLTRLKTYSRAAIVAIALAGTTLVAAPVQAAPGFSFDFSIGEGGIEFGRNCYSDREVRRMLRNAGYDDIRFRDRDGRYVVVRAEKGNRDYRLTIDSCRGEIVDRDRIRN